MPCTKRAYPDAAAAQDALNLAAQRWENGETIDPCFVTRGYLCPECDTYHLTKTVGRGTPTDVHGPLDVTKVTYSAWAALGNIKFD